MGSFRETAARLARGSAGRTEADVQSDVRMFLLDAPLELRGESVVDVALEAQAGEGRRIDVEAGCAAIEVKKNLASKSVFDAAAGQLAGYVRQRTAERSERYVGILTDGRLWVLFHLVPSGAITEVSRFQLRDSDDAERLAAWLETVLATRGAVKPTPGQIRRRLGTGSPAAQLDLADLHALYRECSNRPEVRLKRELWARLLLSALGTNFADTDELFVTHTYLVLIAELIAHQVIGLPIAVESGDTRALLEGRQFALAGIHGVVDADFFDWPAALPHGGPIISGIARRISRFDWRHVEHDVLKVLYESVIDTRTRKQLGEYYTPDWLAQKIVDETFTDPLNQRLLDPACGSGTFLFWAVRRAVEACTAAGFDDRRTLAHVVDHVFGIDLHPVAVTLARVTYLLAITTELIRRADRDELVVPVFLGDSLRWEHDDAVKSDRGLTVHTSDELELVDQDLHFPEGVVVQPARFDRLVETLATKAASRSTHAIPKIGGLLNAHKVTDEADRAAVELAFAKLCRLHDAGRNHVWSYYIRNLARPLSFTRPDKQVDVLLGNPPWLAFRHMPAKLQETYKVLAETRGLWAGGRAATHQDLSDLFVVRAIEQYLRRDGRFAFVMPFAVLSRFQYAGFRTGRWGPATDAQTVSVEFAIPEEFARVKPALFPVPSCVVSGRRARARTALEPTGVRWTGRVRSHHVDWLEAASKLVRNDVATKLASRGIGSPYRKQFRQGATLVPHVLMKMAKQPAGPLGAPAGVMAVLSARSSVEKSPWKDLPGLTGMVERQFVRATHLGATICAFRARTSEFAVVPWKDGVLLRGVDERIDEFPNLAAHWREAERLWENHKAPSNRLSLTSRIDYQHGLTAQLPTADHRVVYTRSGQYLAACRIDDQDALIEQTLYWAAVSSIDEGRYLCAILNSATVAQAVAPLQSRGQHNPRDFAMSLFAVPFPRYDAREPVHRRLSALAERAESVAGSVELGDVSRFEKARRLVREALVEDGVAFDIDQAVQELLASEVALPAFTKSRRATKGPVPDLAGALSAAVADARRTGRPSGRKPASREPRRVTPAPTTPQRN